jgi:hypothetical protein
MTGGPARMLLAQERFDGLPDLARQVDLFVSRLGAKHRWR